MKAVQRHRHGIFVLGVSIPKPSMKFHCTVHTSKQVVEANFPVQHILARFSVCRT